MLCTPTEAIIIVPSLVLQLFSNAMVGAGLVEDPRTLLSGMNELLELALEKH